MTDQEKANCAAILRKAKVMIDANKADAVKRGDIAQSIAMTNRQAGMEAFFRERGVEIEEPDL